MANLQRITTTIVAALVPVMFACNKGAAGGADAAVVDAAVVDAAPAVVDAAVAAPDAATATTAPGAAGCVGKQKAFYGRAGAQMCETPCTSQSDCKLPATCWGTGELLNADGSKGKAETYCKAPSAETTCPKGQVAFVGSGGAAAKPVCEVPCGGNADCTAPLTCNGDAYLMIGDLTHGPAQHYCKK